MSKIPVIDLGELGLSRSPFDPSEAEWKRVSDEIRLAFTDIGFVYLTNHGIPQDMIDKLFSSSKEFFDLDIETKKKYRRGVEDIQGYSAPNQEKLVEINGVQELRESYDIHTPDGTFPDNEVPALRPAASYFFEQCSTLTYRILTAMALALGLDRSFFVSRHVPLSSRDNISAIRILYYPASPDDDDTSITRCGAHTDYGTLTLLFQDPSGGLEVKDRGGDWVNARPIPGTILINAGDIIQFWTGDAFRATEHRVLLKSRGKKARQSIAFFVHPSSDVLIKPLDGSFKYTPLTAKEHAIKRFTQTYAA